MNQLFTSLQQLLHEQLERHRQRGFLEAAMAACALVAGADGRVSLDERSRVDLILESLERLKLFDPHDGVDAFNGYLAQLDTDAGRQQVLEAVRQQLSSHPEQGPLLLRMCQAIAEADGGPSADERQVMAGVCAELGLKPAEPHAEA